MNSGNTAGQTFESNIATDYRSSVLEISEKVNGVAVYNFAVSKVRYRSTGVPANNVRSFFRLIPYSSTSVQYNQNTTYRRGGQDGDVIPLLGISSGEVSSFPCFAAPRIDASSMDMNSQKDAVNVQDIQFDEVVRYFGCWLDINQPNQPQFPIQPNPLDGPFTSSRKTIQELIRNKHQCLVAEIAFDLAPIEPGLPPSMSDKLAQRNLSIVDSANPGVISSRRIPNAFDVQLSGSKIEPDELMIDWGNTPHGSLATIYLPDVNVDDIIRLAFDKYRVHGLTRVDDSTIQCLTGGVTYVPIPMKYNPFVIGLLTVDLPDTVQRSQVYTIVVKQIAGGRKMISGGSPNQIKWRSILGSYQITIPVSPKAEIIDDEQRLLSNLRWIENSIPTENRWYKVFSKYVSQIAARVDGLGGVSSKISPSPSGDWESENRRCTYLSLLVAMLLSILIVRIGLMTDGFQSVIDLPIYVVLLGVGYYWINNCKPPRCRLLNVLIISFCLAAIVLILLTIFGSSTTQLIIVMIVSIVITVITTIIAWRYNCLLRL